MTILGMAGDITEPQMYGIACWVIKGPPSSSSFPTICFRRFTFLAQERVKPEEKISAGCDAAFTARQDEAQCTLVFKAVTSWLRKQIERMDLGRTSPPRVCFQYFRLVVYAVTGHWRSLVGLTVIFSCVYILWSLVGSYLCLRIARGVYRAETCVPMFASMTPPPCHWLSLVL